MTSLNRQYTRDIKSWDWQHIVESAKNNPQENEEGELYGYHYLGSLINPSGKYYLPFACSNVDSCEFCHGSGLSKTTYTCTTCHGSGIRTFQEGIDQYHWNPDTIRDEIAKTWGNVIDNHTFQCNVCHGTGKLNNTCHACGGLGSREAYQDQVFWEVLDSIAESHGGFIEAGEGDPCDSFFVLSLDDNSDNQD